MLFEKSLNLFLIMSKNHKYRDIRPRFDDSGMIIFNSVARINRNEVDVEDPRLFANSNKNKPIVYD